MLAGKTSWQQTSIQWPEGGTSTCAEFADATLARAPESDFSAVVRGCTALRRAIDKAALAHTLPVADQD